MSRRLRAAAFCLGGTLLVVLIGWGSMMNYRRAAATASFVALKGGKCSGEDSDRFRLVPQTTRLSLSGIDLSDDDFRKIQSGETLFYVNLEGCRFSEAAFVTFVRGARYLRHLDISKSNVTTHALESIAGATNMWSFHCSECEVNDKTLGQFLSGTRLRYLDVGKTKISDGSVMNLVNTSSLIAICIEGTAISPSGISELRRKRPDVEVWSSQEMNLWRAKFAPN